jgi:hypothetical protein
MPRPAKKAETIRLNLDLSQSTRERLERLQEATEARSMTEVIGRALAVYEKLVNLEGEGSELILRTKSGKELGLLLVPN